MQNPLRSDDFDRKHPRFGPKSRGTALKLWNTHLRCELHEFILAPSLRCLIHHPVVTSRLSFGRNPIQEIIRFWIALSSCFRGRVVVFHSIVRIFILFRLNQRVSDFQHTIHWGFWKMAWLWRVFDVFPFTAGVLTHNEYSDVRIRCYRYSTDYR